MIRKDGVVMLETPRARRLRTAGRITLVALFAAFGIWFLQPEPVAAEEPARAVQPPRAPQRDPMERAVEAAMQQHPLPPPEPARNPPAEEPQQREEQGEVTVDQLPPGDGTGLDAIPKPGTKPLLGGIIVPEGYTLPPGFMRHYQTTDDGEALPAILVYHPDVRPGDVKDRVVPREGAPFGMPVQWLDPPPFRKARK